MQQSVCWIHDRQRTLLKVAKPRFLVHIQRAAEEAGPVSESVSQFIASSLTIKAHVPAPRLQDDGQLTGGASIGRDRDCLQPYELLKQQVLAVYTGFDLVFIFIFSSGSEGKPKGVQDDISP